MNIPLSPCVPENLVSRDGFSRLVPRQSAHLHTQAESGAYTYGIPPEFRGVGNGVDLDWVERGKYVERKGLVQ